MDDRILSIFPVTETIHRFASLMGTSAIDSHQETLKTKGLMSTYHNLLSWLGTKWLQYDKNNAYSKIQFEYTDLCVSQTCMGAWMRHWRSWHICSPWASKDLRVQLHTTPFTPAKVFAALRGLHLQLRQKNDLTARSRRYQLGTVNRYKLAWESQFRPSSFPFLLYCQSKELMKTAKSNN